MNIKELIKEGFLYFDGAMGTMIEKSGADYTEFPESLNITNPKVITDIHLKYLQAGSHIVKTNTFNAARIKDKLPYSMEEIIGCAVKNARAAIEEIKDGGSRYIAIDIGPTGELFEPAGELKFEAGYQMFKKIAEIGAEKGADAAVVETMSDTYELKAAVLAVKENTSLPVIATVTMDENGKLLNGGDIRCVVSLLEGLNADALGINCGLGPGQMRELTVQLSRWSSLPVFVNPNAGLPQTVNGKTCYLVEPEEYAGLMKEIAESGARILGGCCGTTPEHIGALIKDTKEITPAPLVKKAHKLVSSFRYSHLIEDGRLSVAKDVTVPPECFSDGDFSGIVDELMEQEDTGADILSVNIGSQQGVDGDEIGALVREIQSFIKAPLSFTVEDPAVLEAVLRAYNGKAMIDCMDTCDDKAESIFPRVKHYGGVIKGSAATADRARKYMVDENNIYIEHKGEAIK